MAGVRDRAAPVVGIVAGEASADILGAHLIEAVRQRCPQVQFTGICAPRMRAAGALALYPGEKLAVRGYVEVIKHFPEILSIRRGITRHFLANPPDVFIGVDAPDFNLGLELKLRGAGIPVVHYASPSIWAWRAERIHTIKRAVDHMLVLFPFETEIYDKAGVPATFVGHPLAGALADYPTRATVRAKIGLPQDVRVVALLPGSRQAELAQLGALMAQAARIMAAQLSGVQFVAPMVNPETRRQFEAACKQVQAPPVLILDGGSHDAMAAADVVLVASGTATLEAALLQRPMVITYKVPALTAWLTTRKAYVPYLGLPNILAGEFIVPELLQAAATPQALADAVIALLNDHERCSRITARFAEMAASLRQDTARKAAEVVLPFLQRPGQ